MKTMPIGAAALAAALLSTAAIGSTSEGSGGGGEGRPNVLIFLLDDAGFAHLGAFGGLIDTPNIDRVAKMGLRYTSFHTTALCSPTRAALLTGRNHHSVGTGVITEISTSDPGYTSRIPDDKWPLVEAFQRDGYRTGAFGKWHNTTLDQIGTTAAHDRRPTDLGFDRFYGFLAGDASQWETAVWDDNTLKQPKHGDDTYHFTVDMTDRSLEWMRSRKGGGAAKEPFFLYYAPGAVHAPHHPPPEYAAKYKGRFDMGWDQAREAIFARQKAMGVFPEGTTLAPRTAEIPAWLDLKDDERRLFTRMQEIFAGYLEHTDAQFGRLLAELERTGELDNTIIVVTSDNGASGEGGLIGTYNESRFFNGLPEDLALNLAKINDLGTKRAFNHYPAGWALVGNTPFKFFKQTTNEGGVRDPFIIAWPEKIQDAGALRHQFAHVNDLLPTLLDLSGVEPSKVVHGVTQQPIEGKSFAKTVFDAASPTPKSIQYFEMLGNRALWQDGWKAVAFHGRLPWDSTFSDSDFDDDIWQLYDLSADPTEMHDLAAKYPERLAAMKAAFNVEALKYNVYPLDDSTSARFAATARALTGGRTTFEYTAADRGLPEAATAPTLNRSHEFIAKLTIPPEGAEGAIVVLGGRFGGYALYVQGGRLRYSHNFVGEETYTVVAGEDLPAGDVTVRARFTKTGENTGTMTLYVGDKEVASATIPRMVPKVAGLADSFDVGTDLSTPVSDSYATPFDFTGRIESVVINLL